MSAAFLPPISSRTFARLLILLCLVSVLGGCINSSTTNPPVRKDVTETDTDTNPDVVQTPPTLDTSPTTGLKMVSAGGNHNCAIKNNDGSLWCWGQNNQGQLGDVTKSNSSTFRQTSSDDWVQVTAGDQHTCGITNDGTLYCWGNNASGEIGNGDENNLSQNIPVNISTDSVWSSIATGAGHSCAINQGDFSLWCWGNNDNSQQGYPSTDNTRDKTKASEVEVTTDWLKIATSDTHTCAIKTDGTLWCWGDNSQSQLGDGGTAEGTTPKQIASSQLWLSISLGNNYSCGIKDDSTLWCWGSSSSPLGQTSLGHTTPSQVDTAEDWLAHQTKDTLATSDTHACAIKTDDTLWCWGDNSFGQLGNGTTIASIVPIKVGEDTWDTISVANEYSCGFKKNDNLTLWCWGNNANFMLGHDSSDNTQPSAVDVNFGWQAISTGNTHACAIRSSDETLWCWGSNSDGQIGHDPTIVTEPSTVPRQVEAGTKWVNVSVSGNHTCATKKELDVNNNVTPTLWCWGKNDSGQLGIGSLTSGFEPTKILYASWETISAGTNHSCAVKDDGTLWCWGNNDKSQLGDGGTTEGNITKQIGTETSWTSISLGNQFSCGIRAISDSDQQLYCWGQNNLGQLGLGTNTPKEALQTEVASATPWKAISAGDSHACAIKQDQSLWCWGNASQGQLAISPITIDADPLNQFVSTPTQVEPVSKWLSVSAGNGHTCSIKVEPDPEDPDGIEEIHTLWCWGKNTVGQLGVGTTSHLVTPTKIDHDNDWISVSTGNQHTCAVDSDYIGYCWGINEYGQLANGIILDTSKPRQFDDSETWDMIDSGELHTCGLKTELNSPTLKTLWCGGGNGYGQLGIGSTANKSVPVQIKGRDGSLVYWKYVSTGHHYTCAIADTDALR